MFGFWRSLDADFLWELDISIEIFWFWRSLDADFHWHLEISIDMFGFWRSLAADFHWNFLDVHWDLMILKVLGCRFPLKFSRFSFEIWWVWRSLDADFHWNLCCLCLFCWCFGGVCFHPLSPERHFNSLGDLDLEQGSLYVPLCFNSTSKLCLGCTEKTPNESWDSFHLHLEHMFPFEMVVSILYPESSLKCCSLKYLLLVSSISWALRAAAVVWFFNLLSWSNAFCFAFSCWSETFLAFSSRVSLLSWSFFCSAASWCHQAVNLAFNEPISGCPLEAKPPNKLQTSDIMYARVQSPHVLPTCWNGCKPSKKPLPSVGGWL